MSPSAYDTAWIARLGDSAPELSQPALGWLRANQLEDGSWGTPGLVYHHERLICTVAALNALAHNADPADRERIEAGKAALPTYMDALGEDGSGATLGFELIVPTLLEEGRALGIIEGNTDTLFYEMAARRTVKLAALPKGMVDRTVTVAFSSEMFGLDAISLLDLPNLQEKNGSIAYSPSATAYYLIAIKPGDTDALNYLRSAVDENGAAPNCTPIDTFEVGWALWNYHLAYPDHPDLQAAAQPHLDFLRGHWLPGRGIASAGGFTLIDGDTTGIVYEVMRRFGREPDVQALYSYEVDTHFRCFPLESDPSISTNIHLLGGFNAVNHKADTRAVGKILDFLARERTDEGIWFDKWHASPYYATAHALIAALPHRPELVAQGAEWMLNTQNDDGSWGYYLPTLEETAYAIQALVMWRRAGYDAPLEVLHRGAEWLQANRQAPLTPLWIGKSLYCAPGVVHSAINSAIALVSQESAAYAQSDSDCTVIRP
jgi:halimadienyl-diphosphate synthase